jgi:hypothetical protein
MSKCRKEPTVPYEMYMESEKTPRVSIDADRVETAHGRVNFYKGDELIASFKEEKVAGYVKMIVQM